MAIARLLIVVEVLCALCIAATTAPTTGPLDVEAIRQVLIHGDSTARAAAIKTIWQSPQMTDNSTLGALDICSTDPSPDVRGAAAALIGGRWTQIDNPSPRAISIELRIATTDSDPEVRHDAVSASLKELKNKSDDVVRGLIQSGMTEPRYERRLNAQIIFALKDVDKQRLASAFELFWANYRQDPERAAWAYIFYLGATGEEPPNVQRLDDVGKFFVTAVDRGGFGRAEIDREITRLLPAGLAEEILFFDDRGRVSVGLVVNGVAHRRQAIAALGKSQELTVATDVSRIESYASPDFLADMRKAAAEPPANKNSGPAATQGSYAKAFADLYEHLASVYPNFQMKGIDWKEVGKQLLPRASAVGSEREFGLLVEELVARLQDSHAIVQPASAQPPDPLLPRWDLGIACLIDDRNKPVVYVVEKNSSAQRADVTCGMTIVSVNGVAADKLMSQCMDQLKKYFGYSSDRTLQYDAARAFFKQDEMGAKMEIVLETPDGQQKTIQTTADVGDRYIPRLPVPRTGINDSASVSWAPLGDHLGYIYVRRIQNGLEDMLDQALKDLGPIDGLIIDVRGNSGGGFDEQTAIRNFDLSPANTAQPARPRYRGRIALITDERCISAGEGWASWFIANKRARLFGATTAGASSAKETYKLSNGLYQVIVPVRPYNGFLDRPIERQGLEPDVPVRCNAADIAAGKDTVEESARLWLLTEKKQ